MALWSLLLVQPFWIASWFVDFDKSYISIAFWISIVAMSFYIATLAIMSFDVDTTSRKKLDNLVGVWVGTAGIFLILFIIEIVASQYIIAMLELFAVVVSILFVALIAFVVEEVEKQ
ncbi:MAG TPA: hypothetical protein EYG72_02695 [Candidatus Pacebacteria bacterium]|nr:hypothetical protein [Candidatus Paceibacterota bacterium]